MDDARDTSYISRLPATARFKESVPGVIGMRTICRQRERWLAFRPERSTPSISTAGRDLLQAADILAQDSTYAGGVLGRHEREGDAIAFQLAHELAGQRRGE